MKRAKARGFRDGEITLLCATNAFGMGIDLPNVRYTIHYGIPGSIESFYQQAGRAGRDRSPSLCAIVFSEISAQLSETLLTDSTDGDQVRTLFESRPHGDSDDVLTQLYFHFQTFRGRQIESDAITEMADGLAWAGTARTSKIAFARRDDGIQLQERSILRLLQVGMVADYTKDWGGKSFDVRLREADAEDLVAAYLRFILRNQPGRIEERRAAVAAMERPASLTRLAVSLAKMAMELIYDSVEKSRRRALREMRLLATGDSADARVRQRIEDYFREGELAPQLENLLEQTRVDLGDWIGVYSQLTLADEGEIRGSSARFLESYPDHPGLLVGRALAELMGGESSFEFRDNIERAFTFGRDRYGQVPQDHTKIVTYMLEQAGRYRPEWRALIFTAYEDGLGTDTPLDVDIRAILTSPKVTDGEAVVLMTRLLRDSPRDFDNLSRLV